MASPTISVLVTSYDREPYIAESIESVLSQTYRDFEVIVCDDGSSDRSVDIARAYAGRDARIRVSVNQRNLGDYGNRRQAASLARGRFLKYHDSDDIMYPHCLAAMVEPLEAEPRAGFALSGNRFWPGGRCPMLLTPKLAYEREFLGAGLFNLGPASAMFRTEVFSALGGFPDAGVASDYMFWLRACASVNVLLVPGDLFYYRVHAGQELSRPGADLEYARASSVAWQMLTSGECPLDGESLDQAKRNFTYNLARWSFRRLKGAQPGLALAAIRQTGLGIADWIRYLRPPRRTSSAGTPAVENEPCRS